MTNYKKGRAKEYRIMNKLKKDYDIVGRTAGSHSAIDVFAIRKKDKSILLLQSKPRNHNKKAIKRLEDKLNWLNDEFIVKFKVV